MARVTHQFKVRGNPQILEEFSTMSTRKSVTAPRKSLRTPASDEINPPATRLLKRQPRPINRLAYRVCIASAKALKVMVDAKEIALRTKIIRAGSAVGLLMSFRDWKHVADFFEWTAQNHTTRQLTPSLRIECGEIKPGSKARNQAQSIMQAMANDQDVTEGETSNSSDSEMEQDAENEHQHFQQYLENGVFCDACNELHHSAQQLQ